MAGLIPGRYTGRAGPASPYDCVPGVTCPGTPVSGGVYQVTYSDGLDTASYQTAAAHYITAGTRAQSPAGHPSGPLLAPSDAFGIDSKVDDGRPGLGRLTTYRLATNPGCATSNTATLAAYDAELDGVACTLRFNFQP